MAERIDYNPETEYVSLCRRCLTPMVCKKRGRKRVWCSPQCRLANHRSRLQPPPVPANIAARQFAARDLVPLADQVTAVARSLGDVGEDDAAAFADKLAHALRVLAAELKPPKLPGIAD